MDRSGGNIVKIAFIRRSGKRWCVLGHRLTDAGGKRRNFGCYSTKEQARRELGRVHFFQGRGALDAFVCIADSLDSKGMLHMADAVMGCLEGIVAASFGDATEETASVKLRKIAALLERKGEGELAERLDALLPDVLDLESGALPENPECPDDEVSVVSSRRLGRRRMSADRLYKLAVKLRRLYEEGIVDESSFEYRKFRELRYMLRTGFLLPPPAGQETPKIVGNWWDHFEKEASQ